MLVLISHKKIPRVVGEYVGSPIDAVAYASGLSRDVCDMNRLERSTKKENNRNLAESRLNG
jgi:hypothetical protein